MPAPAKVSLSVDRVLRASLFWFEGDPAEVPVEQAMRRISDGVLAIYQGRIVWVGEAADAPLQWLARAEDWRGRWLTPGFVDLHVHYPQIDVMASPADGLLPWLEEWTFPAEQAFADADHAATLAKVFLDEQLRHGVTSSLVFGTVHPVSAEAILSEAERRGMRLIAGKVLMDRHAPSALCDAPGGGLAETESLISRWHGRGRLGVAITPRFAPTSSREQLMAAGELAAAWPDVWIQSHVAENTDEVRWVAELYPEARSYLDVYERAGLLRPRSVYAHCLWLDANDRDRLAASGAGAAVCPTSNLFLGSGLFDFQRARRHGMGYGLASDVGGGSSFSPWRTMLAAFEMSRLNGFTLSPSKLWFDHTLGSARVLGLSGSIGSFAPGHEADLVALDPSATPLLARRAGLARSFEDWLFSMIVLGDDRHVVQTWVAGEPVHP
jgi:guanine deaminase